MKKLECILFILFTYLRVSAQWESELSNTKATLNSISFYNDRIGWIAGNEGTILKTIDGGESWFKQDLNNVPSPLNSWSLQSISIMDSSIVFIKGYGEVFLKTIDGGKNWYQIGDITNMPYTKEGRLFFIDSLNGWVAGGDPNSISSAWISKTTNGGLSWNRTIFEGYSGSYFYSIEFINKDTGWAASTGNLLYTVDGGKKWNKIFEGGITAFHRIDNILWLGTFTWYVENDFFKYTGYIYKSTNWGEFWQTMDTASYTFKDICFINENLGWAIVDSLNTKSLRITKDGGQTWCIVLNEPSNFLEVLYFQNEKNGWAIGKDGLILHTSTGGVTTNINSSVPLKFVFYLSQNYPNPFNPTTTINYQLPHTGLVTLKVYDLLGKEVTTLVNEEKPAGNYEAIFNGSGLSSGVYFYRIKVGDFSETKKFVLMK